MIYLFKKQLIASILATFFLFSSGYIFSQLDEETKDIINRITSTSDYLTMLGVSTQDESSIKTALRKIQLQIHPDKVALEDRLTCESAFKKLMSAKDIYAREPKTTSEGFSQSSNYSNSSSSKSSSAPESKPFQERQRAYYSSSSMPKPATSNAGGFPRYPEQSSPQPETQRKGFYSTYSDDYLAREAERKAATQGIFIQQYKSEILRLKELNQLLAIENEKLKTRTSYYYNLYLKAYEQNNYQRSTGFSYQY